MALFFRSPFLTTIVAGFIAGTLDVVLAVLFLAHGNTSGTLRYIAKGAFGSIVYEAGDRALWAGAAIHYFIAFCFALGYFMIYPYFPILRRQKVGAGLLYGFFIWCFMRFLILPLTYTPPPPFIITQTWKNIVILMASVGLPISIITAKYYSSKHPASGKIA